MDEGTLAVIVVVAVFIVIVLAAAIKVVQEYERGVVFRLGRLVGSRGPGIILLIPFLERMERVDLRTVTMDVPSQEVITRDNVTIRVNAVNYFRVLNPDEAIVNVENYIRATSQIAQTTLRSVLGQSSLDELLSEREQINQQLAKIIDDQTEPWGVKVSVVEVKDVELPSSMQRAMARQAEAERDKRAKIIHAEGEFGAAAQLTEAAELMSTNPITIQLRYLQTMTDIGSEHNTTIVFPMPIDMLEVFKSVSNAVKPNGGGNGEGDGGSSPRPQAPKQPDAGVSQTMPQVIMDAPEPDEPDPSELPPSRRPE